jgi:heme exporter protein D
MAAERQPVLQSTQLVDDLRETRERQARQDVATPAMAR